MYSQIWTSSGILKPLWEPVPVSDQSAIKLIYIYVYLYLIGISHVAIPQAEEPGSTFSTIPVRYLLF